MDSHIHLVISFDSTDDFSKFMHAVFFRLAQLINNHNNRKGRVFLDRPRTPVIQEGKRLLATMRYLDLNPVRAQMVRKSHHYTWSSHRYYAYGEPNELIDPAPEYVGLSKVPTLRRKLYREIVDTLSHRGFQRLPEMTVWTFVGEHDWVLMKLSKSGILPKKKPPGWS